MTFLKFCKANFPDFDYLDEINLELIANWQESFDSCKLGYNRSYKVKTKTNPLPSDMAIEYMRKYPIVKYSWDS
jgi:hypothetical protein